MDGSAPGQLLNDRADVARWFDALFSDYAPEVRWIAPRRGLALSGRGNVVAHLERELAAMDVPRVCVLRAPADGTVDQAFHEFTIRFRLLEPGIAGVALPVGAEVELERLRVLTRDADGRVAAETCIETWNRLSGR